MAGRARRPLAVVVFGAALLAPFVALVAHRRWGLALPAHGWGLVWPLLAAPIVEEWLFRGLQREIARWVRDAAHLAEHAILRRPELLAAAATTVVFTIAHAGVAAPGLLLAWAAPGAALAATWVWRHRRLDCILLHAWFNVCLWVAGSAT